MDRRIPRGWELAGRIFIFAGFLYILTTLTTNALLVMHPEHWRVVRDAGGHTLVFKLPLLWPRLIHNMLGALIVGSVWLITMGLIAGRKADTPAATEGSRRLVKLGGLVAAVAVLAQVFVGFWLIVWESRAVQSMLFSARPAAMLWMLALLGVLGLLVLAALALALPRPRRLLPVLWGVLALVLTGMFAAREAARQVTLASDTYKFSLSQWTVRPQVSSLLLFLTMFVLALGLVGMMMRWYFKQSS